MGCPAPRHSCNTPKAQEKSPKREQKECKSLRSGTPVDRGFSLDMTRKMYLETLNNIVSCLNKTSTMTPVGLPLLLGNSSWSHH